MLNSPLPEMRQRPGLLSYHLSSFSRGTDISATSRFITDELFYMVVHLY